MKNGVTLSENQCPTCGGNGASHDAVESHRRIQELEGHVQALTERAAVTGKKMVLGISYQWIAERSASALLIPVKSSPRSKSLRGCL